MARFRRKLHVVEAEIWPGGPHPDVRLADEHGVAIDWDGRRSKLPPGCGLVLTPNGSRMIWPGQIIVTEQNGEKFPWSVRDFSEEFEPHGAWEEAVNA